MKKILVGLLAIAFSVSVFAQSAIVRGEVSAGNYENVQTDGSGRLRISPVATDPCQSSAIAKSSAVISITSAATTSLVTISGTTTIYVCGFSLTISQVVTTANTIRFVTGTGATCGTGTVNQTGDYGAGGVTAAQPITVTAGYNGTVFKSLAGDRLCATTAIGATAFFTGVVTYVQQ